jgi:hypothetical protein
VSKSCYWVIVSEHFKILTALWMLLGLSTMPGLRKKAKPFLFTQLERKGSVGQIQWLQEELQPYKESPSHRHKLWAPSYSHSSVLDRYGICGPWFLYQ